ncbi:MAG: flagellar hook capping FlgD N-terminal domain-containing protein [Thermoguttaceae bacterium]
MSLTSVSAAAGANSAQETGQSTANNAWNDVSLESFIKLLVVELQHQDPLDPMNNQEILEQMSQIREIESNQRLTETLESMMLGQTVSTAAALLGRTVSALSDDAEWIKGEVEKISIEDGIPKLHIGSDTVDLKNVSEILPQEEDPQ